MTEYELFYLVGERKKMELDRIRKEVEETVVKHGGEMLPSEFSDERRMEYPIKKERRGIYIAKRFQVKSGDSDVAGLVSKDLGFSVDILRFLIVRAEGLPTLEESQERVRRVLSERKRPVSSGRRPMNAPSRDARPAVPAPVSGPIPTDKEIDEKLEEVLDI